MNNENPVLPSVTPLSQASTAPAVTPTAPTNQTFTVPTMPNVDASIDKETKIEDIPKPYNQTAEHLVNMGTDLGKDVNARQQRLIGNNYSPTSSTTGVNPVSYQQYYQPQLASAASNLRYTGLYKAWQTGAERAVDAAYDRLNKAQSRYNNYVQYQNQLAQQQPRQQGGGARDQQSVNGDTISASISDEDLKKYGLDRATFESLDPGQQSQYLRHYIDTQLDQGDSQYWNDQSIRDYASSTVLDRMGITDPAQRDKIMQQGTQENKDFFGNPEVGDLWTNLYVEQKSGMTGWVDARNTWQTNTQNAINEFVNNGGTDSDWQRLFEEQNLQIMTTLEGSYGAKALDATYRLQSIFSNSDSGRVAISFNEGGSGEELQKLADSLETLGFTTAVTDDSVIVQSEANLEKQSSGSRDYDQVISYLDEALSKCSVAYGVKNKADYTIAKKELSDALAADEKYSSAGGPAKGDSQLAQLINVTYDKITPTIKNKYSEAQYNSLRARAGADRRELSGLLNLHDDIGRKESMQSAANYFLNNANFKESNEGFGSVGGFGIWYSPDTKKKLEEYRDNKKTPITVNTADAVNVALSLTQDELLGVAKMHAEDPDKFNRYMDITQKSMYDPIVISDGTMTDAAGNIVPAGNYIFYHAPGTEDLESYKELVKFLSDKPAVLTQGENGYYWEGGFTDDADENLLQTLMQNYWRDSTMVSLSATNYSDAFENSQLLNSSAWSQAVMYDYYHNTPGVDEEAKDGTENSTFGGTKTYDIFKKFNELDAEKQQHFIEFLARKSGWKEFTTASDNAKNYNKGEHYNLIAEGDNISDKDAAALLYIIQQDCARVADDGTFYGQFKPNSSIFNSDTMNRVIGGGAAAFNESTNYAAGLVGLTGAFISNWWDNGPAALWRGITTGDWSDSKTGYVEGDFGGNYARRLFGESDLTYASADLVQNRTKLVDLFDSQKNADARAEIENFQIFSGFRSYNDDMYKAENAGRFVEGVVELVGSAAIGAASKKVGQALIRNNLVKSAAKKTKSVLASAARKAKSIMGKADDVVDTATTAVTATDKIGDASRMADRLFAAEKRSPIVGELSNTSADNARRYELAIQAREARYFDDIKTVNGGGLNPEFTWKDDPYDVMESLTPFSSKGLESPNINMTIGADNLDIPSVPITRDMIIRSEISSAIDADNYMRSMTTPQRLAYTARKTVDNMQDTIKDVGRSLTNMYRASKGFASEMGRAFIDAERPLINPIVKGAGFVSKGAGKVKQTLTGMRKFFYNAAVEGQLRAYAQSIGRNADNVAYAFNKIGVHGRAAVTTFFNQVSPESGMDLLDTLFGMVQNGRKINYDDVIGLIKNASTKVKLPGGYRAAQALINEYMWNAAQLYMSPAHYTEDEWDAILSGKGGTLDIPSFAQHFVSNALMGFAVSNTFALGGKALRHYKAYRYTKKIPQLRRQLDDIKEANPTYIKKLNKLNNMRKKADALYDSALREFNLRGASPRFRAAYEASKELGDDIINDATKIFNALRDGSIRLNDLSKDLQAQYSPSIIRGTVGAVKRHEALNRRMQFSADFNHLFNLSTEDGLRWQILMNEVREKNSKLSHEAIRAKQIEASNKFLGGIIPEAEAKEYFRRVDEAYDETAKLMEEGKIEYKKTVGANNRPNRYRRRKGYVPETGLRDQNDWSGGQVAYAGLGDLIVGKMEATDFRKGRTIPQGTAAKLALQKLESRGYNLTRGSNQNVVSLDDFDFDFGRLNIAASNPVDNLNALINTNEVARMRTLIDASDFAQANKIVVVDDKTMNALVKGDRDETFAGTKRQQREHARANNVSTETIDTITAHERAISRERRAIAKAQKKAAKDKVDEAKKASSYNRRKLQDEITADIDKRANEEYEVIRSINVARMRRDNAAKKAAKKAEATEAAESATEATPITEAVQAAAQEDTGVVTQTGVRELTIADDPFWHESPTGMRANQIRGGLVNADKEYVQATYVKIGKRKSGNNAGYIKTRIIDKNTRGKSRGKGAAKKADVTPNEDYTFLKSLGLIAEDSPKGALMARIDLGRFQSFEDLKAYIGKNLVTPRNLRNLTEEELAEFIAKRTQQACDILEEAGSIYKISEKTEYRIAPPKTNYDKKWLKDMSKAYNLTIFDFPSMEDLDAYIRQQTEVPAKLKGEQREDFIAKRLDEVHTALERAGVIHKVTEKEYKISPLMTSYDDEWMDDMFKVYKPATFKGTQQEWVDLRARTYARKEQQLTDMLYSRKPEGLTGRVTDAEYSVACRRIARAYVTGDIMPNDYDFLVRLMGSEKAVDKFFIGLHGISAHDLSMLNMAKLETQATMSLLDAGYNISTITKQLNSEHGTGAYARYLQARDAGENRWIQDNLQSYSATLGGRRLVRSTTAFIDGANRIPHATYFGGVPLRTYEGAVEDLNYFKGLQEQELTNSNFVDIVLGLEVDNGRVMVITGDNGTPIRYMGNIEAGLPEDGAITYIDQNDLIAFRNRVNDINGMSRSMLLQQSIDGSRSVEELVNKAYSLRERYTRMMESLPDTENAMESLSLDVAKLNVMYGKASGVEGAPAVSYKPVAGQRHTMSTLVKSDKLQDFLARKIKANSKNSESAQAAVKAATTDMASAEVIFLPHAEYVARYGEGVTGAKVRSAYDSSGTKKAKVNYDIAISYREGAQTRTGRGLKSAKQSDYRDQENTVTIPYKDRTSVRLSGDINKINQDIAKLRIDSRRDVRSEYNERARMLGLEPLDTYGVETIYRFTIDGDNLSPEYLKALEKAIDIRGQVVKAGVRPITTQLRQIESLYKYKPIGTFSERMDADAETMGYFDKYYMKSDGKLKLVSIEIPTGVRNPVITNSLDDLPENKFQLIYKPNGKAVRQKTRDGFIFRDIVDGSTEATDTLTMPMPKGDRRRVEKAFHVTTNKDGTTSIVYKPKGKILSETSIGADGAPITKFYDVYSTGTPGKRIYNKAEIDIPQGFAIVENPGAPQNPREAFMEICRTYGIVRETPLNDKNKPFQVSLSRTMRSKSEFIEAVSGGTNQMLKDIDELSETVDLHEYHIYRLANEELSPKQAEGLRRLVDSSWGDSEITLRDVQGVLAALGRLRNSNTGVVSSISKSDRFARSVVHIDGESSALESDILDGYFQLLNSHTPQKVDLDTYNYLSGRTDDFDTSYLPIAMNADDRRAFVDAWSVGTASRNVDSHISDTASTISSPATVSLVVADNAGVNLPVPYKENLLDQADANRKGGSTEPDVEAEPKRTKSKYVKDMESAGKRFRKDMQASRSAGVTLESMTALESASSTNMRRAAGAVPNTKVYYDSKAGITYMTKDAVNRLANMTGRTFSNINSIKTIKTGTEEVPSALKSAIVDDIQARQAKSGLYVPGNIYLSDEFMDMVSTYDPKMAQGGGGGGAIKRLLEFSNEVTNMQLAGGIGRYNALTFYQFRSALMSRLSLARANEMGELFQTWSWSRNMQNVQQFLNSNYTLDATEGLVCTRNNILELYSAVSTDTSLLDALADSFEYRDISQSSKINDMVDQLKAQLEDAKVNGSLKGAVTGQMSTIIENIFDDPTFKRYLPVLQLEMIAQDYRRNIQSMVKTMGTAPSFAAQREAMQMAVDASEQYWGLSTGYTHRRIKTGPDGKRRVVKESLSEHRARKLAQRKYTRSGGINASTVLSGLFFAGGFRANAMTRIINGLAGVLPWNLRDVRYRAGRRLVFGYISLAVIAQLYNAWKNDEYIFTIYDNDEANADYTKVGLNSASDPNDIWKILMNLDELGTFRPWGYDSPGINTWSSMMTIPNTTVRFAAGVANSFLPYPHKIETQSAGPVQEVLSMFTSPLRSISELFVGTYYGYSVWGKNASAIDEDGNVVEYSPLDNAIAIVAHIIGWDNENKREQPIGGSGLLQHEFYDAMLSAIEGNYGEALYTAMELPVKSAPKTRGKAVNSINNYVMPAMRQYKAEYDEKLKNEDITPEQKEEAYRDFLQKSLNQVALWSKRYNVLEDHQDLIPMAQRYLMAFLSDEWDYNTNKMISAYRAAGIESLGGWDKKSSETDEEYKKRKEEVSAAWSKQKDKEFAARQALRQLGFDPVGFDYEDAMHKRYADYDDISAQFEAAANGEIDGFENMKALKNAYNDKIQSYRDQKNWDAVRMLQDEYANKLDNLLAPFVDKYGRSILFKDYGLAEKAAELVIIPMDDKQTGRYDGASQNKVWLQDRYGVGYNNDSALLGGQSYYEAYNKLLKETLGGKAGLAATRANAMLQAVAAGRMVVTEQQLSNLIELEARLRATGN